MPAFRKALEYNVDGFENDVHLTKDGVAVVCHDNTVDRTSNGTGTIEEMDFADLRSLSFDYGMPGFAGVQIPTLAEWFDLVAGMKLLNVEIKDAPNLAPVVKATIDLAKEKGCFDALVISSFADEALVQAKAYDPTCRTALLFSADRADVEAIFDDPAAYAHKLHLDGFHPFCGVANPDFIEACHAAGLFVNVWTTNTPTQLRLSGQFGVDAVITDDPALAMEILYAKQAA
jgi:glycerophosphoryl diester phosphodiesterase